MSPHYKDDIIEFKGMMLPVRICKEENNEFYHVTKLESLKLIIDSGYIKPVKGGRYDSLSNSVSLSASPSHAFGSGNLVIVFKGDAVRKYLMPMRYFRWVYYVGRTEEQQNISRKAYTEIEDLSSNENISLEEAMARLRIAPDMYIQECEWYSFDKIPVNVDNVKKISFFIPYVIRGRKEQFFNCEKSGFEGDKYASFENPFAFGIDELIAWISDVKKYVESNGFKFDVDSQYPYIRNIGSNYGYDAIIEITGENLDKLSAGEMPVISKMREGVSRSCRK